MNKIISKLKFKSNNNSDKYEINIIQNNAIFTKESKIGNHLLDFYYLVL